MAITFAQLDTSKPIAASAARFAYYQKMARAELEATFLAANAATNAGSDTTQLIGAPFGAIDAANAALFWTALLTCHNLLAAADNPGGFTAAVDSMYYGNPG